MIKRIPVSELKVGMFVHDLQRGWLDHPFPTNRFRIKSKEDLREILRLGLDALDIDTARGVDLEEPGAAAAVTVSNAAAERPAAAAAPEKSPSRVPLEKELLRASHVLQEASAVVTDVMENARLGKQIELDQVTPAVEDMVGSVMNNDGALIGLTRIRRMDRYTFEHSVSVAVLLTAFGKHLGMDQEELVQIGIGGLLHDVGKVKTPLHILNKPGRLTDQEFAVMRRHAMHSREFLENTPGISEIAFNIAVEHHERVDGSGYPARKRGDDISFHGRMSAIVDVYDALCADRVYKKGMSPHAALKLLVASRNAHFSAELVYSFIHCVGVYPIGTLVQLSDGRLAVVTEHTERGPRYPKVRVMFDIAQRRFRTPVDFDLSCQNGSAEVSIVGAQEAEKWRMKPEVYLPHAGV